MESINGITADTEINIVVNGRPVFSIINSPNTGLLFHQKTSIDKTETTDLEKLDDIQGLYAIVEAAYKISMGKIDTDTERVLTTKKPFARG